MSKTSDKIMLRPGIKMTYGVTYHSLKFLRFLIRPLVKKYVDTSMNHHYQKMFKELFTNNKNGLNIFNIKQTNKQNIEKRISRFSYKLLLKNISSIKKNELIANTNSIASELTTKSMKYVQEQLFYENSEKKLKEIITEFKHEILKSTNKTTYELIKQIVDYYFKSEQNHVLFKTYEFVTNRKAKNDKITKKLNDNSKKDFLNDIVTLKYFYLVAEDFISKLNYVHEEKTILYYLITKTEEIPVGALKIEFYGNSFYERAKEFEEIKKLNEYKPKNSKPQNIPEKISLINKLNDEDKIKKNTLVYIPGNQVQQFDIHSTKQYSLIKSTESLENILKQI